MTGSPFLLAGLGNPGAQYAGNRHNVGFMAADAIAKEYGYGAYHHKFGGLFSDGRVGRERALLLKPQTFMNESGRAVAEAARFFKIPPENVIVFYDDLDLPPGKIRVKKGGGNAGHNGLKSIDAHLGENYWRVRIGIGHPGDKNAVTGYVLSNFSKEDRKAIDGLLPALSQHLPLLLAGDEAGYMNKIALACHPALVAGAGANKKEIPQ